MDWTNLLWLGELIALLFVMLRGCGGVGGGCGMGTRQRNWQDGGSHEAHGAQKRVA